MRTRGTTKPTCRSCQHFLDDALLLEGQLPGIGALSSALGSTRGDAGICKILDTFHDPREACPEYEPRKARH